MTAVSCAELLSHTGEATQLEQVVETGPGKLAASLTVRPGTAFSLCDGSLAAWAGPELVAQAVSVFANLNYRKGAAPGLGLLLGVRDFRIRPDPFPAGSLLRVEVTESTRDEDGRGVFNCRILRGGEAVAEGRLTVLQPDDPWTTLGEQVL